MKSILTAAAALAAGVCCADVTSSNIVGYQTSAELTKGANTTYAAMFENVTGENLPLSGLKLSDGCPADGTTSIMWWVGHWEKAFWVELDFDPNNIGWGDDEDWLPIDKTFEIGEAFFVQASSGTTEPTITAAGQVLDANGADYYGIELPKGQNKFVSNPFPGSINLQDIKLSAGCPADGTTSIMWWVGHWEKAFWVELDFNPEDLGWGDDEDWLPIEKTMALGEGYFVQASSGTTEPEMLFPNPLASAKE